MWKIIYMAQTKSTADDIEELLAGEGFLIRLRPVYKSVPESENYYEIQVLQSEALEAHNILMENGY